MMDKEELLKIIMEHVTKGQDDSSDGMGFTQADIDKLRSVLDFATITLPVVIAKTFTKQEVRNLYSVAVKRHRKQGLHLDTLNALVTAIESFHDHFGAPSPRH